MERLLADEDGGPMHYEKTMGSSLQEVGGWWAGVCFPCMKKQANQALVDIVKAVGEDFEQDMLFEEKEYSIFYGMREASTEMVELEYTDKDEGKDGVVYSLAKSEEMQQKARERFAELYLPIIPMGLVLYGLTLGGGFISGLACDCNDGPLPFFFVLPAIAICLEIWMLNKITLLMSSTEIEGRPMLRLLKYLSGLDNYQVMVVLNILDIFSRFTRAQFVGYVFHCHDAINGPFVEIWENSDSRMFAPIMEFTGIHGLAVFSFLLGPIVVQFGYMLFLKNKLDTEMEDAKKAEPGKPMKIVDSIDDLGALMNWGMLNPAGKVLHLAAVPVNLDERDDIERLWDRMKTEVMVVLARDLPDGVMQMTLQAWFLCVVFPGIDGPTRAMLCVNILLASVGCLADAFDLISMNRRVTVAAGFFLLMLLSFGFIRTAGAFTCDSSIVGVSFRLHCLPNDLIHGRGNWTSGTLPG